MDTIRFELIKDSPAGKKGTVKEWPANHAGIVRALIAEGIAKKLEPIKQKAEPKEKIEAPELVQKPEKVETIGPPNKKPKK